MGGGRENSIPTEVDEGKSNGGRIERFVLTGMVIFLFIILLLASVINPIAGFVPLLIVSTLLIVVPGSRPHGVMILLGFGILFGVGLIDYYFHFLPLSGMYEGLKLFAVRYLPEALTFWLSVLLILLTPFLLLEASYWIIRTKKWLLVPGTIVTLFLLNLAGGTYMQHCKNNFDAVYALRGQTLNGEELFQKCGEPLWFVSAHHPHRPNSQWRYSDAKQEISVNINEDGTVTVSGYAHHFLDL